MGFALFEDLGFAAACWLGARIVADLMVDEMPKTACLTDGGKFSLFFLIQTV